MGAGKVDYENLLRDAMSRAKRIRWRILKSKEQSLMVLSMFGYCSRYAADQSPLGPWFGYTKAMLLHAPCVHCGQIGVFTDATWEHTCPARSQGHILPCVDPHPCKGEPSMAVAPMWRDKDWVEVTGPEGK